MKNKDISNIYLKSLTEENLVRATSLYNEYKISLEDKILRVRNITLDILKEKIKRNYAGIKRTQDFLKDISKQYPLKKILEKNIIGFLYSKIYLSKERENKILMVTPAIKTLDELIDEKKALKKKKAEIIYKKLKLIKDIAHTQNIELQNLDPRDIHIEEDKKDENRVRVLVSNFEYKKYEIEALKEIDDMWELARYPDMSLIMEMMLGKYKDGIYFSDVEKANAEKTKDVDKRNGLTVIMPHEVVKSKSFNFQPQDNFSKDEKEIEALFSTPKKGVGVENRVHKTIKPPEPFKNKKKEQKDKKKGGYYKWEKLWEKDEENENEREEEYNPTESPEHKKEETAGTAVREIKEGNLEKKVKMETPSKPKVGVEQKQKENKEDRKVIYEEELIIPGRASFKKISKDEAMKRALLLLNGPVNKYGELEKEGLIDKAIKVFRKKYKKLFEKEREGKGRILEIDSKNEIKDHIEFPHGDKGDYRDFLYRSLIRVLEIDLKNNNH